MTGEPLVIKDFLVQFFGFWLMTFSAISLAFMGETPIVDMVVKDGEVYPLFFVILNFMFLM